jgi:hypothetical protein
MAVPSSEEGRARISNRHPQQKEKREDQRGLRRRRKNNTEKKTRTTTTSEDDQKPDQEERREASREFEGIQRKRERELNSRRTAAEFSRFQRTRASERTAKIERETAEHTHIEP